MLPRSVESAHNYLPDTYQYHKTMTNKGIRLLYVFLISVGISSLGLSATKFVLSASASQTAGTTNNLTISATDALGVVDTTYKGDKTLTFSGATSSLDPVHAPTVTDKGSVAQSFGQPTVITFAAGVATNVPMILYRAESASISATDGTLPTPAPQVVNVTFAALAKFKLASTSPQTNGVAFTGSNALTAEDAFGNTVTTFSASADNVTLSTSLAGTISGLGGGNNAILNQAGDFTSGVANLTGSGMMYTGPSGTGTFNATSGSGKTVPSPPSIIINPGPASRFSITGTPTQIAGGSQSLTITAQDVSGNTATSYVGDKSLTFGGALPSTNPVTQPTVSDKIGAAKDFGTATTITFALGVATATGGNNGVLKLYKAEGALITATQGTITTPAPFAVLVSAGSLGKLVLQLTTGQTSGVAFTGTNTITAQDDYGNVVTDFSAVADNVTVVPNSPLIGRVTGLGSAGDSVLNQAGDFVTGVANVTGKMKYTGTAATGTFTAATATTGRIGMSNSVTVSAGGATHFVIAGSSSQTAGTPQNLTITAKDAAENTDLGYTGDKSLTFSGANSSTDPVITPKIVDRNGSDVSFGTPTTITFASGVATVAAGKNGAMKLYKAETAPIVATEGTRNTPTPLSVNVGVASHKKFALVLTSPQINGIAFAGTNTVTAQDSFGNVVSTFNPALDVVTISTSLAGTISGLGSGNNNILDRPSDFTSGVANVAGKIKYTGPTGTGTFSVSSVSGKTDPSPPTVAINPGGASRLVITGVASQVAGTTQNLTITARDSNGNVSTGYSGTKSLTFSGANSSTNPVTVPKVTDGSGADKTFGSATSIVFTSGVAAVSGPSNGVMTLYKTESAIIAVTDGTISSSGADRLTVNVTPGPLSKFVFDIQSPQSNGTAFTGVDTLSAQDAYGNLYTAFDAQADPVKISAVAPLGGKVVGLGSGNDSTLNRTSDFTGGIANLSGVMKYFGNSGTGAFKATSFSNKTGTTDPVTVNPGAVRRFVIQGSSTQTAGTIQALKITAQDTTGNTVTGYTGDQSLVFSGANPSSNPARPARVFDKNGNFSSFGSAATIAFTNGIATASAAANGAIQLFRAETASVVATQGSTTTQAPLQVVVSNASLGQFALSFSSPQVNGSAFTGINTIAAQDSFGNVVSTFDASADNVTLTANSSLVGTITGLGSLNNNVLNRAGDFVAGMGDVTGELIYTGNGGTGTFTVTSGTGRTGVSGSITVNNPMPTLVSVNPANISRSQTLDVGLRGTNFLTNITTSNFGDSITVLSVTVNRSDSLTARISLAPGAALGPRNVSVTNVGNPPATLPNGLTVNNIPSLVSIEPPNGLAGLPYTLTFTGTNFIDGVSTVGQVGDPGVTVNSWQVNSLTRMTVSVNISSGAVTGPRQLFVFNSGTYGGQSGFQPFTVGSNPVPTLTSVQPDSANRLQRANLVFKGTNFFPTITDVRMGNGIRVDTVIVDSSTQLRASVTLMDTAATGSRGVSIFNKAPGGGSSATRPFKVNNPLPTLTGVAPANANRLQTLDVVFVGTNFIKGVTTANFGPGITRVQPDSVSSSTQLTARVHIDSNAATGSRNISVTNAGPGGGTSATQTFTINNPHPTITNLSDTEKIVNSPQFVLTVDGANFVAESIVRLNGVAKATTPVNGARLRATIPASDLDTAQVFLVSVLNPPPGGDSSNVWTFTVKNPAPVLSSVSPDSAARLQSLSLQLRGSNFVHGVSTVQFSGDITVDTTTVTDTSHITVKITIPATSQIGSHTISVINPPPGGGTSASIPFVVTNNPPPTLLSLAPAFGNRLQKLDVAVTGTNFINGVTSVDFGPGITTDSVIVLNPTHLTARITITAAAATGLRTVSITNAPPGGGTASLTNAFQVNNPAPVLIGVSPTNGDQLQTLDLTFRGRNFIDGVTFVIMGTGISVNSYTFDSDSSFTASITITNFATVGPRNVQVQNPAPGGGTDILTNGFVVGNNPRPTLTGINPTSGRRLDSLDVVFHGTNFISGVTTVSLGNDIDIISKTVDSSGQITARIFIRPTSATGLRNVVVSNSPPGGGKDSIVNGFNVMNPAPTLATVTPSTIHRMQKLDLVLRGSKFINGVTKVIVDTTKGITVNSTSVDSATRMAVTVTVDTFAVTGAHTISVMNPSPGGGTSATVNLTVDNPSPTLVDVQPPSGSRLSTLDISLSGTNFISGISRVQLTPPDNIAVNSTRVDSASHITANITIAANAVTGPRTIAVVNDAPGGGSSATKTFTVEVLVPTEPIPSYPLDNQTNLPTSLTLSWSTSTNAAAYHVQLATTVGFTTTVVNDSAVLGTSRQVGPLNNNTLYFWRVRARNSVGVYSSYSPIRRFTTKLAYPDTMTVTNTWTFPTRNPGESVTADYKIIGLPGNSNSPVSSFIPGTAGTDWQMYWDNGSPSVPGCYVKYDPSSSRFTFTTGAAFWLIMRSSWSVNATISTSALNDSGKVGIPLHAGWNLITNPYGAAVFWYQIQAANGGFSQALSTYNSGWAGSSTFAPYTGYMFSNESNLDTLWIPYSIVALLGKEAPPSVTDGWRVSIDLQSGQYSDRVTSLGVSSAAKEGLDRLDNRRPRGIAEIPTVSFHRPEWDPQYSDFATDIRPDFNDVCVWKFEVTSKPRKAIQLIFNGIGSVPSQFQVYLVDEARSRYVDLRANAVYEFTPAMDISDMRVVIGTPDAVKQQLASVLPTVFELGNNFPNPFNPTTTIPVSVPRVADVALKVYATTGEEVRTIYSGSLAPGRYWFTWDGRNERGNSVATGVYFVRFTSLAGPTFTGKMLLMK